MVDPKLPRIHLPTHMRTMNTQTYTSLPVSLITFHPSCPLYLHILSLIPLINTHSFVKSFFSHPTHCSCLPYPSISFSLYTFHTHAHASILHIHILLDSRLMLSMHFDFLLVYITPYPSSHAFTILSSAPHSSHPTLYSSPLTHLLRPIH